MENLLSSVTVCLAFFFFFLQATKYFLHIKKIYIMKTSHSSVFVKWEAAELVSKLTTP